MADAFRYDTNTLPRPRTSLVGREAEIAAARAKLLDDAVPLLTLTGPGGVGKTRLALAIAADVGDSFRDGVAFIPLAPVRDASLVMPTVARVLGVIDVPGMPIETTLATVLRERHLLLVLDNLEQVTASGPLLGALLDSCPRLQVLATSRVRLHVGVEHLIPVPPLLLPKSRSPVSLSALTEIPAISLFLQRARHARPDFALTAQNAPTVAAIVESLDGLPLAIELAAARLSALSPDALLVRLEHRLRLLRGGHHDLPPRLRTMADAIAWSYDLLDSAEQTLLRRLAVFLGGWTIDAAEAVCPAVGDPPIDVFEGITSLVDKSLIRPLPTITADQRFTMLETIREFGLERLIDTREVAAARESHANWSLALAEAAEPHLGGAEQAVWLDRLEADHDNLRAALGWWRENGDADRGLRLATALMRFWDTRDFMSEGRAHLLAFLALPSAAVSPRIRASGLNAASELATWEAEHETAARLAEEALAIRRALDDQAGIARSLWLLGVNILSLGDEQRAAAVAEEGLVLARNADDREAEALFLRLFGSIHVMRDEPALAIPFQEAALTILHELGARAEICSDLGVLALATGHLGDREQALALWDQVLPLAREVGEEWMIAFYLEGHAELALAASRADTAARLLGAADAWRVAHGAPVLSQTPSTTRAFVTAREQLGEVAYAAAFAAGQGLTLDEGVEEAQRAATAKPQAAVDPWITGGPGSDLTRREREVLALLCQRFTDPEIAEALYLSPRTASKHVGNVLGKLGASSRRDAAAIAARLGLV